MKCALLRRELRRNCAKLVTAYENSAKHTRSELLSAQLWEDWDDRASIHRMDSINAIASLLAHKRPNRFRNDMKQCNSLIVHGVKSSV